MTTTPYETDSYQAPGFSGADDELLTPEAAIEAELDGDADDLDDLEAAEDSADDNADEASGTKAKSSSKPNRAMYRRAAAKAIEVHGATDTVRALAASVLGSSAETVELATSIMAAPRLTNSPLADIETISEACAEDPFEAAITAGALGRPRLKGVWSLLHTIGSVGTPTAPAADAKAALAVVKAVNTLTDDQQLDLASAAELLKRS